MYIFSYAWLIGLPQKLPTTNTKGEMTIEGLFTALCSVEERVRVPRKKEASKHSVNRGLQPYIPVPEI